MEMIICYITIMSLSFCIFIFIIIIVLPIIYSILPIILRRSSAYSAMTAYLLQVRKSNIVERILVGFEGPSSFEVEAV